MGGLYGARTPSSHNLVLITSPACIDTGSWSSSPRVHACVCACACGLVSSLLAASGRMCRATVPDMRTEPVTESAGRITRRSDRLCPRFLITPLRYPSGRPRKAGECEGAHIGPRGKASDMRAYERMEGPSNDAGVCAHPVGARLGYIRPCAAVGRAVEPASTSPLIPVASPPVSRAALPTDSGVHRRGRSHTARTGCADKASGLTREHDI